MPMALAATLTTRAKGPDLSISAVMVLSQIIIAKTTLSSSSLSGIILAVVICAAIGAVSGVLTVYAKLPALAVTAGVFIITAGLCRILVKSSIYLENSGLEHIFESGVLPLLICIICLATTFLLIAFTKLGTPFHSREQKKHASYLLAYVVGGIFAALSGLLMVSRLRAALPYIPYSQLIYTVFVVGCVASSRFFDNRFVPAAIAFAATLLWSMLNLLLVVAGVVSPIHLAITFLFAAAFATVALVNWVNARKAARA